MKIRTTSPNASTKSPRTMVLPLMSNPKSKSVPINENSTGWRTTQACSNTSTTGLSCFSTPPSSVEIVGLLRFCSLSLLRQPVAATNADMIHANGPAPGHPNHVLPVTANSPPAPSRNDLLAVTNRFIFVL